MHGMEQRNLILAIAISAAIYLGFLGFSSRHRRSCRPCRKWPRASLRRQPRQPRPAQPAVGSDTAPALAAAPLSRDEILKQTPRIAIDTPRVKGSISLTGGRLDDLTLADFHETVDKRSPAIVLLSPSGAANAYLSEEGWVGVTPGVKLPAADTVWTADRQVLTAAAPVTLSWDNGDGLVFSRTISLDDNYMFTVKQSVTNNGSAPVRLKPYALVSRAGAPPVSSTWIFL